MKKTEQKAILILAVALSVLGGPSFAADESQGTVLSGVVDSVVSVGTNVKEGDVLITVDTLAGPVPAARSSCDGVVTQVSVQKGEKVNKEQIVAIVKAKE